MENAACLPFATVAEARGGRDVPPAAPALWAAGTLGCLALPTIAIVGTRAATDYGRRLARAFAAELGAAGCCIISGLALGIDAAAHHGALEVGAPTVGVLGGGHRVFFPRRNRPLAERMLQQGGLVLSPFAPDEPARPGQFLARNGVVAALADAVVVIEAPARSGALNTAGWAAGRIPVFAVPGDVDRPHVAGCHALIRDGAILARTAQDVLDDLRLTSSGKGRERKRDASAAVSDPLQRRLVEALGAGEQSLDDLCSRVNAPPAQILAAIAFLEMGDVVEPRAGRRYVLR